MAPLYEDLDGWKVQRLEIFDRVGDREHRLAALEVADDQRDDSGEYRRR